MRMDQPMPAQQQRVMVPILDLACGGGGAMEVERALERLPGILQVYVNPATEIAYVHCDPTRYDPAKIVAAIEGTGFHAGPIRTQ